MSYLIETESGTLIRINDVDYKRDIENRWMAGMMSDFVPIKDGIGKVSFKFDKITMIICEPDMNNESDIITPPSPAQLRNEKQKESDKAITLDTLLEEKK